MKPKVNIKEPELPKPEYISISGLKGKRQWTDSLIKKFLGKPDKLSKNPHYACAAPVNLYDLERVIAVENTAEFKEAIAISKVRSLKAKEVANKVVKQKTTNLCQFVLENTELYLPNLSKEELIKKACKHYNWNKSEWLISRNRESEEFIPATPNSPGVFLKRIVLNYLRHECSDYEGVLDYTTGKVGKFEAYDKIRDKLEIEIFNKYPWLKQLN